MCWGTLGERNSMANPVRVISPMGRKRQRLTGSSCALSDRTTGAAMASARPAPASNRPGRAFPIRRAAHHTDARLRNKVEAQAIPNVAGRMARTNFKPKAASAQSRSSLPRVHFV